MVPMKPKPSATIDPECPEQRPDPSARYPRAALGDLLRASPSRGSSTYFLKQEREAEVSECASNRAISPPDRHFRAPRGYASARHRRSGRIRFGVFRLLDKLGGCPEFPRVQRAGADQSHDIGNMDRIGAFFAPPPSSGGKPEHRERIAGAASVSHMPSICGELHFLAGGLRCSRISSPIAAQRRTPMRGPNAAATVIERRASSTVGGRAARYQADTPSTENRRVTIAGRYTVVDELLAWPPSS